jgi:hypothetical protein
MFWQSIHEEKISLIIPTSSYLRMVNFSPAEALAKAGFAYRSFSKVSIELIIAISFSVRRHRPGQLIISFSF